MNSFVQYAPTKIIFGKGVEDQVGAQVKAFGGTKVLIHYGGGSVKRSGLLDKVKASLEAEGIAYVELGGAVPNPRLGLVHEGIELCRKEGVDFVLGIGGGSAIDSAKAIALGVPYDGDVWDAFTRKVTLTKTLPHGNIITLAATGSETSNSAVITNDVDGSMLKRGLGADTNRPAFTLMDPELLYSLPPYQTACGIVDIMMHTHERFFSKGGQNEVSDKLAVAILRTMIQFGPVCMKEPDNYEARSEVMWAGSISHNGMTGLGRAGDWGSHQLEHALGGIYDVAHGAGLAAVWGSWARYVYKEDVMRFARYAVDVWDITMNYDDPEQTALAGIEAAEKFFVSIGMPICITDLLGHEPSDEELKRLAYECSFYSTRKIGNFKVLDETDMYNIYVMAK